MLIQQRHVVCLLVLLQCCLSVYATQTESNRQEPGAGKPGATTTLGGESGTPGDSDWENKIDDLSGLRGKDRVGRRRETLEGVFKESNITYWQAWGCMAIWKEWKQSCEKRDEIGKHAVAEAKKLAGRIIAVTPTSVGGDVVAGAVKWKEIETLVGEASDIIKKTEEAIEGTGRACANLNKTNKHCRVTDGNLKDARDALSRSLEGYRLLFEEYGEVSRKAKDTALDEKSESLLGELKALYDDYKNFSGKNHVTTMSATNQLSHAREAIGEARKKLEALRVVLAKEHGRPEADAKHNTTVGRIVEVVAAIKPVSDPKAEENVTDATKFGQRIDAEAVKERQRREEEERKRKEEEAKRKAEEEERKKREAEERAKREEEERQKAEKEAEKARKEEEEKRTRASEDRKAKALEEEKKKAEEEAKAKEAKEKLEEEAREEEEARKAREGKKAKEMLEKKKPKKEKDSSSSPALLHSPLLILLLCVLGSILVC